ncbi:hypothetical protein SK571_22455 [Lentzea sp. BCCO 10_0798]|uniref:CPBP family intramembrane metalloprotease n=1 Tax=Lentzea kristufekii TaxID=3095430 RepID=A0ABU4TV18_9PSEU|nr:hypothetical protein [Lentzea sp. BCCO 10_0798]MDX8052158.1 hypothetical protein [Lentzea sp. BCCO 10_0798]
MSLPSKNGEFAPSANSAGNQWWRHTGRGVLAPALVHLATNFGGVLVAWYVLSA